VKRAMVFASLIVAFGVFGEPPTGIIGYGGLTVGVEGDGTVSVLRWPGPGSPNQLSGRGGDGGRRGGRWEVFVDGAWRATGAASREGFGGMLRTKTTVPETSLQVTQVDFVVPERSLFVSRLEMTGSNDAPRIRWVGGFSPATRHVPQLPVGGSPLDVARDFAAFVDGDTVWHFRPEDLSMTAWARAERFAATGATPEQWASFDRGVWIAAEAGPGNRAAGFGTGRVRAGGLSESAVGDVYSVIEPIVGSERGVHTAWVVVSLGGTMAAARENLPPAEVDPIGLFDERYTMPEVVRVRNRLEGFDGRAVERLATTLFQRWDRATGRFVRNAAGDPKPARDYPRYGAWIAVSLDALGFKGLARARIAAYLDAIRLTDGPRRPYGSMPESFYTDGVEGSPYFVVDVQATARVLWAADRIARGMTPEKRRVFLRTHREAIAAGAEFLVAWRDPRSGVPLWSPDPVAYADAATRQRIFDAFAGISGAIRMMEAVGTAAPEAWEQRRVALRALTASALRDDLNPAARFQPLLYAFDGLDEAAIPAGMTVDRYARALDGSDAARWAVFHVLASAARPGHVAVRRDDLNRVAEDLTARGAQFSGTDPADPPAECDAYLAALMLFSLAEASGTGGI